LIFMSADKIRSLYVAYRKKLDADPVSGLSDFGLEPQLWDSLEDIIEKWQFDVKTSLVKVLKETKSEIKGLKSSIEKLHVDRIEESKKSLTILAENQQLHEKIATLENENAHLQKTISIQEHITEAVKDPQSTKPKAKPKEKSNTPVKQVKLELPEPVVCKTTDGNEFNMYENTTCYLDKDTWKKCNFKNMTDLYNAMKKYKSCACEQFGNGNYLVKSPIGSETMVKDKYPKGGGADYESIMKSLKHNKTAQNKKVKTFVFNWGEEISDTENEELEDSKSDSDYSPESNNDSDMEEVVDSD
jgi:hypothetical protein